MKGTSAVVVGVLLVLISLTLATAVYFWSRTNVFESFPEDEMNYEYQRSRACLSLEQVNATGGTALIRNCGFVPLSELMLYVDSSNVSFSYPSKLDPNANFTVTFSKPSPGTHTYFATADLAETPLITLSNY